MLFGLVMTVHIIVCFILIGIILVQGGKGGLSENMGGSTTQSILGTSAGTFLTRATAVAAVLFVVTCVSLTIISSHQSGSLMRQRRFPMPVPEAPAAAPATPAGPPSTTTTSAPEPLVSPAATEAPAQ